MRAAIRTQRYRMDVTLYQNGVQLPIEKADGNIFDLEMDPYEMQNLWLDPQNARLKLDLWKKLLEWDASMDRTAQVFTKNT